MQAQATWRGKRILSHTISKMIVLGKWTRNPGSGKDPASEKKASEPAKPASYDMNGRKDNHCFVKVFLPSEGNRMSLFHSISRNAYLWLTEISKRTICASFEGGGAKCKGTFGSCSGHQDNYPQAHGSAAGKGHGNKTFTFFKRILPRQVSVA